MIKELVRRARALPIVVQDGALALRHDGAIGHQPRRLATRTIPRPTSGRTSSSSSGWVRSTWRRTNPLAAMVVDGRCRGCAQQPRATEKPGLPFAADDRLLLGGCIRPPANSSRRLPAAWAWRSRSCCSGTEPATSTRSTSSPNALALLDRVDHRREQSAPAASGWPMHSSVPRGSNAIAIADARQAVSSERLRIAQELHDVVAHAMSVIAVQSGMGAHVIDTQPAEAKKALQAIETTSRMRARRTASNARRAARGRRPRRCARAGSASRRRRDADRDRARRRCAGRAAVGWPDRRGHAARQRAVEPLPNPAGGVDQRVEACGNCVGRRDDRRARRRDHHRGRRRRAWTRRRPRLPAHPVVTGSSACASASPCSAAHSRPALVPAAGSGCSPG